MTEISDIAIIDSEDKEIYIVHHCNRENMKWYDLGRFNGTTYEVRLSSVKCLRIDDPNRMKWVKYHMPKECPYCLRELDWEPILDIVMEENPLPEELK